MSGARHAAPVWLAQSAEAETVAALLVEFRDHIGKAWPSANAFLAGVERLIERSDCDYLLGAPDQDTPPAGVCQLRYRFSVWTASEDCWLEDLFVRQSARSRGLGAALVEAAAARAVQRGCRRIELDASEANDRALRFYGRLGFSASSKSEPPARDLFLGRRLD